MMCSMFTNVTDELRDLCKLRVKTQSEQYVSRANLQFALHLAFEATEYNLALGRLETVNDRGNGSNVIRHGEENEFLVYELAVRDLIAVVIEERPGLSIRLAAKS